MTRMWSRSSILRSFCDSLSIIRLTGTPVHFETTAGDVLLGDLLAQHRLALLQLRQPRVLGRELLLELGEPPVAQLRDLLEIALPLGLGGLELDASRSPP